MAKNNKKIPETKVATGSNVKIDDRHILPNLLIQRTEEETLKQYSDYLLDRENEKFQLLNGVETSWKELREAHFKFMRFIAEIKRGYEKTFPPEIYSEWRRLNGWDKNPFQKHHKPIIFALYTILFIYGRFPKEILPTLEDLNKYIYPGIRLYKHFELLTDEGYKDIETFIQDVIKITRTCNDMYEFRVKYAAKYGKPFSKSVAQLDAFRDNDNLLNII